MHWSKPLNPVETFLHAIDASWTLTTPEPVVLRVLGSAALFLQTQYSRGTKDTDVIEASDLSNEVKEHLRAIAGQQSALFQQHRLYVDIVSQNIPMLPNPPTWRSHDISTVNFRVEVLDIHEVVVSKLKRWNSSDRDDARAMVEGSHVSHTVLVECFERMANDYRFTADCRRLPKMAERLNELERDAFAMEETVFELLDDLHY